MELTYLLDSNVVIGFLAGEIPTPGMDTVKSIVNLRPNISVITQIEILRFSDSLENEASRAAFVASSVILPLNDAVVRRTIALCKGRKIKLPDAIIAATALEENFVLVTRNIGDFKNIPVLSLLNPWDLPVPNLKEGLYPPQ